MKKRIVILGGGESGVGAAILAQQKDFDVFLSDNGAISDDYAEQLNQHKIAFEQHKHTTELILNADEVVKSPGIPDNAEIVKAARNNGISIISEIEFAARYTTAKIVAITGSNGKTTTTMLIYQILLDAGYNVGVGGNMEQSFARQVAQHNYDFYVLELSSFQLEGIVNFRPDIAVLLNITPDHLDRYDNKFENYVAAKMRIIKNQTGNDALIYNADDEIICKEVERIARKSGFYTFSTQVDKSSHGNFVDSELRVQINNPPFIMDDGELLIRGTHNMYNTLAAGIAAKLLMISDENLRKSLAAFTGVEHRLELYLKIKDVVYINDSKATNVNATWYALESMPRNTIWIAGGQDKGNDYSLLLDLVKSRVRMILCIGRDNSKLIKAFGDVVDTYEMKSMKHAVEFAHKNAKIGSAVLLSPACASYDRYKNYKERGLDFKNQVRHL